MNKLSEILPQFMQFNAVNTTNLILLLGLIMFLGACGGKIFQKLKIPQVVGYIVIGILIGQSGLQVLSVKVIAALTPLSTVALSLIGFLIGAELKTSVIKKYGKQFAGILLFEAITPFFVVAIVVSTVVFLFIRDLDRAISLGLILGAISSATAPAATTDVLKEYRTKGPLTSTVLGIVAMDDAVALILYAISSSIAGSILGAKTDSFGVQLLKIAYDIAGSILLGGIFGFLLGRIIKHVLNDEGRILSFSLGTLLLCTGIASMLQLDNILASMSIGFFLVNFAGGKIKSTFSLVEKFTPPIYVLFFVLVGAKMNIWKISALVGFIALIYIICRTAGKSLGSWLGAKLTKAPSTVRKYLPFCLLSQAGVAIGLSILAGQDFADTIGGSVMLIITATTFVVQIVGPICVKYGVKKSGESGLDICEEDILKDFLVSDLTNCGTKICDPSSSGIVFETETLKSILDSFSKNPNLNYAVKKQNGTLAGIITLEQLKESLAVMELGEGVLAMDIMEKCNTTVSPKINLAELNSVFIQNDKDALPIVSNDNQVIGIAERSTVEHFLHAKIVEIRQKLANIEE
ncbi:MAG: cation:proton antiporter domain-containing protein [Treponemataceae bacterium]